MTSKPPAVGKQTSFRTPRGLQALKEVPVQKPPLNDSSEGVDDFRAWSYFQKNTTKLKIFGHSSAWCPKFAEEVRHQRFYQMDAPLVVRKKKTPKELEKEQEELKKRAQQQLQKWLLGPDDHDKDKKDKKKGRKTAIYHQNRNGRRLKMDGAGSDSDAESDVDSSAHGSARRGSISARRGSIGGLRSDSDSDLDRSRTGKRITTKKRMEAAIAVLSAASTKDP